MATAVDKMTALGAKLQPTIVQRFLDETSPENPFLPLIHTTSPHIAVFFAPGPAGIRKQMKYLLQALISKGVVSAPGEVNQSTWVWNPLPTSPLIPVNLDTTEDTEPPTLLIHLVNIPAGKAFTQDLLNLVTTATALDLIGCSAKVIRK